jgi:hypothetical protein
MSLNCKGPASLDCLRIGTNLPALNNVGGATMTCWVDLNDLPDPTVNSFYAFCEFSVGPGNSINDNSRFAYEFQNRAPSGTQVDIGIVCRAQDSDGGSEVDSAANSAIAGKAFYAASIDYTAGFVRIYINASLVATGTASNMTIGNTEATNSAVAGIGSADDGLSEFTNGRLEDLRIYSRILSDNEILTIFSCQGIDGIVQGLQHRFELQSGKDGGSAASLSSQDSAFRRQDAFVFNGSTPTFAPSIGPTFRRRLP